MKYFGNDPVLLILLGATLIFTSLTIFIAFHLPGDGQTFQLLGGLTTGFGGAVLARVKPQTKEEEKPGNITEVERNTSTIISTPESKT